MDTTGGIGNLGAHTPMNAALGALLGAAVGDAAGAVLEFCGCDVTADMAMTALTMPGGGALRVGPGQFTDDTELALSLAHGLSGHPPQAGFPSESVAQRYTAWLASRPFDIGNTCRTAFMAGPDPEHMQEAAFMNSSKSKANGALMRCTPLAIWAHRLPDQGIAACAAADAMLSHPNRTCQDTEAAYCIALAHLIRCPGDSTGAVARTEEWAQSHAGEEVRGWLLGDSAVEDLASTAFDATANIGFVKHAFILSFYALRQRLGFEEGLMLTLQAGGDTDTNAAIVGGALGALWGAAAIPPALAQPVLGGSYPAGNGPCPGHRRPQELVGARIPELAEALFRAGEAAGKAGQGPGA